MIATEAPAVRDPAIEPLPLEEFAVAAELGIPDLDRAATQVPLAG